tara:strand:- start:242 stop:1141 length:900 start_codon:yes stop_codon:yes gene_type:complete
MKILVNRKPVNGPWGGGNLFVQALCDRMTNDGHDVVHKLSDNIDTIFMQDPRYSDLGISINEIVAYKKNNPNTKITHRVNECDARKNTTDVDALLRECSKYTDTTIFVSNWMKQYHIDKGWACPNTHVIYNGVDKDHFFPIKDNQKMNNGKINLVTHHWSNNWLKGFDVYNWIDEFIKGNDKYTFTYIGRENGTFKNTRVISPLSGKELGNELSKYDVYITGTRFDPGPNHVLESLSCEIPTYAHSDGGGAVEFSGNDHTFCSIGELESILNAQQFSKNSFDPHTWEKCIDEYMSKILY